MPPGADAHTFRDASCLVRLVGSALACTLASSGLLARDPTDNNTLCLPHHVLEGLLGRALTSDGLAAVRFGTHRLKVERLSRLEVQLKGSDPKIFDAPCSSGMRPG